MHLKEPRVEAFSAEAEKLVVAGVTLVPSRQVQSRLQMVLRFGESGYLPGFGGTRFPSRD